MGRAVFLYNLNLVKPGGENAPPADRRGLRGSGLDKAGRAPQIPEAKRADAKGKDMTSMDDKTRTELEAAAFRTLVAHLRDRTDVQNIDLMNLAGFCRNCLSKWYLAAAEDKGVEMDYAAARELVYGMPYEDWKDRYQTEATAEQKAAFVESHKHK